jgi:hypothetical protein
MSRKTTQMTRGSAFRRRLNTDRSRRRLAAGLGLLVAAALSPAPRIAAVAEPTRILGAESYRVRPLRVVVPLPAAAGADIVARLVGEKLTQRLGQSVVLDNRPGRGTVIGRRYRCQGAARWLHVAARSRDDPRHQRIAGEEPAVRPGQGLRADRTGHPAIGPGRETVSAGEYVARTRRPA